MGLNFKLIVELAILPRPKSLPWWTNEYIVLTLSSSGLHLGCLGSGSLGSFGLGRFAGGLLLHFLLLLRFLGLLLLLGGANGLLPLRLSDFGLLVSFGHDIGQSGSGDGAHEFLCSPRPLLGRLFDHAFAVLATVQHRPVDLSGIALQGMISLAFRIKEDLGLSIRARDSLPVSRVDLQPGKRANFDFQHF